MGQIALEKYLKRTGCIYGGITLHEEEKIDQKNSIGVNVFKDGSQQKGFMITTDKRNLQFKS